MSASELIAELERLAQDAKPARLSLGRNLFMRVRAAASLVNDQFWVEKKKFIRTSDAANWLEQRYFPEIVGTPGFSFSSYRLSDLIIAMDEMPLIEDWEDHIFNLPSIIDRARKSRAKRIGKPPKKKLDPVAAVEAKLAKTEFERDQFKTQASAATEFAIKADSEAKEYQQLAESSEERANRLERELARANAEIDQLKRENAALKSRLRQAGLSPVAAVG